MFATRTLNVLADYIGIMNLKIGFYAFCAQQIIMDRNTCVISIIKDKNTLIMQRRNQNIVKHFFLNYKCSLTDLGGGVGGLKSPKQTF